jgi:hypothetical protein
VSTLPNVAEGKWIYRGGSMKCKNCKAPGTQGPIVLPWELPKDKLGGYEHVDDLLLFEIEGQYYCNPCHLKFSSICFQCATKVNTLYLDKRCKARPYVCEDCVDKPTPNHLRVCYASGCMTPGEIAHEEFVSLKMDGEI